ncbi:MAG: serine/threonine-protein kinase [Planctomycetota bacterium]
MAGDARASEDGLGGAAGAGRVVAGRYALRRRVGRGASAEVWDASDAVLDRVVAVKLFRGDVDGRLRDGVVAEARAQARVRHPGVVEVFDAGVDDGGAYIAMAWMPGGDLRRWVREHGPASEAQATAWLLGVAEGLAAAHGQGLRHRDVKPSNLLLDERGVCKLADFGVAGGDGRTGGGTVHYLPPEADEGLDGKAIDAWGLAATLFYVLTGEPPFALGRAQDFRRVHRGIAMRAWPEAVRAEAPGCVAFLERALGAEVEDRPSDAAGFVRGLRGAMETEGGGVAGRDASALAGLAEVAGAGPLSEARPVGGAGSVARPGGGSGRWAWLAVLAVVGAGALSLGAWFGLAGGSWGDRASDLTAPGETHSEAVRPAGEGTVVSPGVARPSGVTVWASQEQDAAERVVEFGGRASAVRGAWPTWRSERDADRLVVRLEPSRRWLGATVFFDGGVEGGAELVLTRADGSTRRWSAPAGGARVWRVEGDGGEAASLELRLLPGGAVRVTRWVVLTR